MGGQGHFKQARETKGRRLLDEYKKRSLRVMKGKSIFIESIAVCVELRAYKNL
jgi:hypothetical protein